MSKDQEKNWSERSIELSKFYKGKERGLEAYLHIFGLTREDLDGKKVLDLGAGPTMQFSQDIKEANLDTSVAELSPDFIFDDIRHKALESNPSANAVVGLGQELPFASESFDSVFIVHVLDHVSYEIMTRLLSEALRVTKKGGRVYCGPVYSYIRADLAKDKNFKKFLNDTGIKLSQSDVPVDYGEERLYDKISGTHYDDMPYTKIVLEK